MARMAVLLAGLGEGAPGTTVNRLCGSGMDAVGMAARAIKAGEADLILAGGVESMTRAPFVMGKADSAFSRNAEIYDTTIGWRFVNPKMKAAHGIDSMPETAENVAQDYQVSRADQDAFALRSQQKTAAAQANGRLAAEIVPVEIPQRKGDPVVVDRDEHPRETTLEALGKLKPDRAARRHGHRRQRLGRQRRGRGPDHRLGQGGGGPRPDAAGADRRHGHARAWRRGSWAWGRRRRPRRCWAATACRCSTST